MTNEEKLEKIKELIKKIYNGQDAIYIAEEIEEIIGE